MDAYLFIHFSEFLTFREFVNYLQTSKLYREKLVIEYLNKRHTRETYVMISGTRRQITCDEVASAYDLAATPHMNASRSSAAVKQVDGRTTISFSTRDNPIELFRLFHHKKLDITIHTPVWKFHCGGDVIFAYNIEDLRDQEFTFRSSETGFAWLDVTLFYDKAAERVMIYEVRLSYITKLRRWLRLHYIRRYVISVAVHFSLINPYISDRK